MSRRKLISSADKSAIPSKCRCGNLFCRDNWFIKSEYRHDWCYCASVVVIYGGVVNMGILMKATKVVAVMLGIVRKKMPPFLQ